MPKVFQRCQKNEKQFKEKHLRASFIKAYIVYVYFINSKVHGNISMWFLYFIHVFFNILIAV